MKKSDYIFIITLILFMVTSGLLTFFNSWSEVNETIEKWSIVLFGLLAVEFVVLVCMAYIRKK